MKTTPRNRYSDELKTEEWEKFRNSAIEYHSEGQGYKPQCINCGIDTIYPLHVRHKFYKKNARPWEYEFDDVMLLCENCHGEHHDNARIAENIVTAQPPHVSYDIVQTLLVWAKEKDPDLRNIASGWMRNAAREVYHRLIDSNKSTKELCSELLMEELTNQTIVKEWPLLNDGDEKFFGYVVAVGIIPREWGTVDGLTQYVDFAYNSTHERYLLPNNDDLKEQLIGMLVDNLSMAQAGDIYGKVWIKRNGNNYSVSLP